MPRATVIKMPFCDTEQLSVRAVCLRVIYYRSSFSLASPCIIMFFLFPKSEILKGICPMPFRAFQLYLEPERTVI